MSNELLKNSRRASLKAWTQILAFVLVAVSMVLAGCGGPADQETSSGGAPLSLSFTVPGDGSSSQARSTIVPSGVGSVNVTISGPGMDTITDTFNVSPGTTVNKTYYCPSGSSRTIAVKFYSGSSGAGSLVYQGESTVDLLPGTSNSVVINMASAAAAATLFTRSYGDDYDWEEVEDLSPTSDGGLIAAGYTDNTVAAGSYDLWVIKLNSDGTEAWQKTYGGTSNDRATSIRQTTDTGYILTGYTSSFGAGSYDTWVIKLNSDGTVAWQKTYGGTGADYAWSMHQTSDGGYIIAGSTNSSGAGVEDVWVLKLDSSGTVTWQKTYGGTGNDRATSIRQTSDSGFIVAGYTYSSGAGGMDVWVLKLNSDGTVAWQKAYGGTGVDYGRAIRQTTDTGYILTGYTSSFGAGSYDTWVIKLNSSGTVVWEKAYGTISSNTGYSVEQTSDGGYIVGGSSGGRFQALKLDSSGTVAWQKGYQWGWLNALNTTPDGGFILGGGTDSFVSFYDDVWILRVDSNGDVGTSCTIPTTTTLTAANSTATVTTTSITPVNTAVTGTRSTPTTSTASLIEDTQCTGP